MFKKIIFGITLIHVLIVLMTIAMAIFMYFDIGHIPTYENPEPSSYRYIDEVVIICFWSMIAHIFFLFRIFALFNQNY